METAAVSASALRQVQAGGLTFPVLSWGRAGARPVLLLHGFPQEPSTWAPVAQALARDGFQVFAPWQRGYVASARPSWRRAYSCTQLVGDVVGIADGLGLARFDVVGFGVAGAQAWMVAAFHKDRVRSVTSLRFPHPAALASTVRSDPEQREKWQQLQREVGVADPAAKAAALLAGDAAGLRRFLASGDLPQPFLDRYVTRLKEPGALAAALSWNQAISLDEFARVPAVGVAALLVWTDGPAFAWAAVCATRAYVHARLTEIVLPGSDHFILERSPDALIGPLREHLGADVRSRLSGVRGR